MPIYEFVCESCDVSFELLAKLGQKTFCCESCNSGQVRKVVSQTSFQLKGSGWAKDAYDNKSSASESAS
jgi:putative FmdB family regulatory protein